MSAAPAVLQLSSTDRVARWLGEIDVADESLIESLDAARELVSGHIDHDRVAAFAESNDGHLPASLHRWVTMEAARLQRRSRSIFGADQFAVGAEAPTLLLSDPTLAELLAPWLSSPVQSWTAQ